MGKIITTLFAVLLSTTSYASDTAVYWTVYAWNAVHVTSSGTAAINIGNSNPYNPNPSETLWEPCKDNMIYFHQSADGTLIEEKYVDRMLKVALAAVDFNGSRMRVAIDRDENGNCFTSQVYMIARS
ncbi:hypothetical protein ACJJIR_10315 [Microbulbifer sp. SSSA008]|uniref:hypothetical protein n=1 Tax=Microbulbifer sp. SSSA008 TaxID=3243380 RepID=UPI00403A09CF